MGWDGLSSRRKRRACVEATTSRGLGFHRPYYHLLHPSRIQERGSMLRVQLHQAIPAHHPDEWKENGERDMQERPFLSCIGGNGLSYQYCARSCCNCASGLVSSAWIYRTRSEHSQTSCFPTSLILLLRIPVSSITLLPGDSSSHVLIPRIF